MSENIPESIPTSHDPRSKRPTKRRALTSNGQQAKQVEALFANPDREIVFPEPNSGKPRQLAAPPEIVQNVQGSSAGAGSGEFHVYKASRRREYERLRLMEEESQKEKDEEEYEAKKEGRQKKDDEKTRKNREKRERAKKRKANNKTGDKPEGSSEGAAKTNGFSKGPRPLVNREDDKDDRNEDKKQAIDPKYTDTVDNPDEIGITIHDDD